MSRAARALARPGAARRAAGGVAGARAAAGAGLSGRPGRRRGPGRHGIGNAFFVYFRDPDGHLVELATPGLWPNY